MHTSPVINAIKEISRVLGTNVPFVLILTYVKIVKRPQAMIILSLKLKIQNKLLIKLSPLLMTMSKTLSKLTVKEFNYLNSLSWTISLKLFADQDNQEEDTAHSPTNQKENARKRNKKRNRKSKRCPSLKKKLKFRRK